MQTTIQLDDTLLAQATKVAQAKGLDLSHFIEEMLRDRIAPISRLSPGSHLSRLTIRGRTGPLPRS